MQMKKPFNYRPAVFIAVSLCLGIVAAYFFVMQNYILSVLFVLLSVVACGVVFLPCYNEFSLKEKTVIAVLCLILFLTGGFGFGLTVNDYKIADLESMNEKQYRNCMDNWQKIIEME